MMIFQQNKLNFGYVQVKIGTVQDEKWANYRDITGRYWNYYVKNILILKLRFRQKFRQIKVNFGKVQVEIGTVQDADSTKSGEF